MALFLLIAFLVGAASISIWTSCNALGDEGDSPIAQMRKARSLIQVYPNPGRARLDQAERLVLAILQAEPYEVSAWDQLAYIERVKNGSVNEGVIHALRSSYISAPLSPENMAWRIGFCFEHWSDLGPDLRNAAHKELFVFYTYPPDRGRLDDIQLKLTSPSGRLAFALIKHQAVAAVDARDKLFEPTSP